MSTEYPDNPWAELDPKDKAGEAVDEQAPEFNNPEDYLIKKVIATAFPQPQIKAIGDLEEELNMADTLDEVIAIGKREGVNITT